PRWKSRTQRVSPEGTMSRLFESSRTASEQAALSNGLGSKLCSSPLNRRAFLQGAVASTVALAWPRWARAEASDLGAVRAEIERRHDEAVQRLQEWVRQPSIAAENRGMTEGCDLMMRLLRDAGFGEVTKVPTDGPPGIFATV